MRGRSLECGETSRLRIVRRSVLLVVAFAGLAGVCAMFAHDRAVLAKDAPVAAGSTLDRTRVEAVRELESTVRVADRHDSIAVERTALESPEPLFHYAAQSESRITLDLVAQDGTTIELHDLRGLSTPGGAPVTIEMGSLVASLRSDGGSTIRGLPSGRYGVLAYRTDWMLPLEQVFELGAVPDVSLDLTPDAVISVAGRLIAPRPGLRAWHGQHYVRLLRRFPTGALGGTNLVSVGFTRMTTQDRYRFRAIPVHFGESLRIESLSGVFPNPFVEIVVPKPVGSGRIEAAVLDPWSGAGQPGALVRSPLESGVDIFASGVAMGIGSTSDAKVSVATRVEWQCVTRPNRDASRNPCEADLRLAGREDSDLATRAADLILDLVDGASGLPAPAGETHVIATHEDGSRLQFTAEPSVIRIHTRDAIDSPGRWTIDLSREGTARKTFEIVVRAIDSERTTIHALHLDVLQVVP